MTNDREAQDRSYPDQRPLDEQPQWVQDFPTDMPTDDLVARREFVKFMVLTSGAFATGQCWIGLTGRERSEPMPRRAIAALEELQARRVIEFRYPEDGDPCLLIWLGDGRYVGYSQKCPHLACAVVPDLARQELFCPCHNGHFELNSGRPIAGPARRPLPLIQTEVVDGTVFATGVELRTA